MMIISVLEPLGVEQETFAAIASGILGGRADIRYYADRTEDPAALIERSRDADVVVLSNFPYRKNVIEHCPNLKMICVAFTGVDHVDVDYCRERGITVCNCAGYSTVAVADLTFGLAISLLRNILPCDRVVRQGGTKDGLVGCELEGKKFGVVGTGAIGARVAAIAKAFGCEVYAYSRTEKPELGLTYLPLDELMATCDIVSLHVPLSASTKGLIHKDNLALMKPDAYLINTARGPVVDSQALADALKAGLLAGAAVDVFEMEPPIPEDHPLFGAPHLIATPHVAFATKQAFVKRAYIVFENIAAFLDGQPQHVV